MFFFFFLRGADLSWRWYEKLLCEWAINVSVPADLKQHVLWFLDNGYLAHEVQDIFNVSHSSMGLLQNPLQGCPHSLTVTQTHSLIQMVQNTSNIYLYELPDWLALEHDIMVS